MQELPILKVETDIDNVFENCKAGEKPIIPVSPDKLLVDHLTVTELND